MSWAKNRATRLNVSLLYFCASKRILDTLGGKGFLTAKDPIPVKLLSSTNSLNGAIIRCAFTDEFEAMNFSYDIEQRDDVLVGSTNLRNLSQSNSLIQSGNYNKNLIEF
jgi:hypothetical protein